MENLSLSVLTNSSVISLENSQEDSKKSKISDLTTLANSDLDVKQMIQLIVQYDLRDKAVELLAKKISKSTK